MKTYRPYVTPEVAAAVLLRSIPYQATGTIYAGLSRREPTSREREDKAVGLFDSLVRSGHEPHGYREMLQEFKG